MSDEKTIAALPDKLALGGVTYNVGENPELEAFRSACVKYAAQTEKNKLYSQMNELRNQILALKDVKVVAPTQEPVDTQKLKADIVTEMSTLFSSQLKEALAPLQEVNKKAQAREINDYRNQLLMQNNGKCIPELVVGETKEQLDAALANSIKLFAQYGIKNPIDTNGAIQTNTTTTPATTQNTTLNTTNSVAQPTKSEEQAPVIKAPAQLAQPTPTDLKVKGMKVEDYAKQRERLLAEAEKMIGS